MARKAIKDFIYLDIERVRSALAQAVGGVPSERTHVAQHQAGGQGEAHGRIPFIAEAAGSADYHYLRSASETQSLHDQIFEELRGELQSQGYVSDLSSITSMDWIPDRFVDGAFIVTKAPLKIVDYAAMISGIQGLPSLIEVVGKVTQNQGTQQSSASAQKGVHQPHQEQNPPQSNFDFRKVQQQFKALPIKPLADLVGNLYGNVVRLKILPIDGHPEMVFVGTAETEFFRYSPTRLTSLYGSVIDAGWICMLQINKGEFRAPGTLMSQTGNAMEDGLEQLSDNLSDLGATAQRIEFPAVAVTPIAIYREIPHT